MNKLKEYKSKIKGSTAWPYILWLNEKSAQLDFPLRLKVAYNYLTNVEYNKAFGSNKDYITIQANWPSFGVDSLRIKKVLLKN